MEEVLNLIANHGVSVIIVALFIYDWLANKKDVKETLDVIKDSNTNIASCLNEIKQSNTNTSKSLEILQKTTDNQSQKIDKILEVAYDKRKNS